MPSAMSAFWRRIKPALVLSRHSALPVLRRRLGTGSRSFAVRALSLAGGSTMIGTSVALLVQADLGLPPYDVLSSGLADTVGLSLGQAGWLGATVLFVVATLLGRRPSPWGIAYILGNGVAIDAAIPLLNQPEAMVGRAAFLLGGILVMAAGINLVLYSGTTGGPFELLMLAGEDRGVNRMVTRYGLDFGVLIGGIALGGAFGIGTVIHAALMGLVLQAVSQVFADHQLGRHHRLSARVEPTVVARVESTAEARVG